MFEEDIGIIMSDATISKTIKRKRTRKRIRKLIIWMILIALAAGAVYLFVLRELKAAATLTYDSYTTTRGSISNSMSFSGSIGVVNDETLAVRCGRHRSQDLRYGRRSRRHGATAAAAVQRRNPQSRI